MTGFIKRLFSGIAKSTQNLPDEDFGTVLLQLQRTYWKSEPIEKEGLTERIESLDWNELLRLHHLNCLDLALDCGLANASLDDFDNMPDLPACPETELCKKLVGRLGSAQSPFRPRIGLVIQRSHHGQLQSDNRESQLHGELQNASITHLGALEVIRIEQQLPSVAFVPLDELQSIQIGPPSLFSSAMLNYEAPGRSEMVYLPLIYGLSWLTEEAILRDESFTHFMFSLKGISMGMGLGQQDFQINESLFGLASIESIEFPLDMRAQDFEERCRRRGLDPSDVRRMYGTNMKR